MYVHSRTVKLRAHLGFFTSITTPEKWDSMTRRWVNDKRVMSLIKLFLVPKTINRTIAACR